MPPPPTCFARSSFASVAASCSCRRPRSLADASSSALAEAAERRAAASRRCSSAWRWVASSCSSRLVSCGGVLRCMGVLAWGLLHGGCCTGVVAGWGRLRADLDHLHAAHAPAACSNNRPPQTTNRAPTCSTTSLVSWIARSSALTPLEHSSGLSASSSPSSARSFPCSSASCVASSTLSRTVRDSLAAAAAAPLAEAADDRALAAPAAAAAEADPKLPLPDRPEAASSAARRASESVMSEISFWMRCCSCLMMVRVLSRAAM